jgi:5'(3')-deoxyribonucleotidase
MRRKILLDCDGVICDFVKSALDLIARETGSTRFHHEVVEWDIFAALGVKHLEPLLYDATNSGGFCENLALIDGSKDGVEMLRRHGDIVIVTSPLDARNWVYERAMWLKNHFGFSKKEMIFTAAKHMVWGDVLIDDSDRNLREWKEYHPEGCALLWDCPWNRHAGSESNGVIRVSNWHDVNKILEAQ